MPNTGIAQLEINHITTENFAPFGKVIEFSPNPEDERFEIIVKEEREPWRVAVFRVRQRSTDKLECHPNSMETFEPLRGTGILFVAESAHPEHPKAFLLDTPVCLNKGIWHEVVTLSEEAIYKITENKDVLSQFHAFHNPIGVMAVEYATE